MLRGTRFRPGTELVENIVMEIEGTADALRTTFWEILTLVHGGGDTVNLTTGRFTVSPPSGRRG